MITIKKLNNKWEKAHNKNMNLHLKCKCRNCKAKLEITTMSDLDIFKMDEGNKRIGFKCPNCETEQFFGWINDRKLYNHREAIGLSFDDFKRFLDDCSEIGHYTFNQAPDTNLWKLVKKYKDIGFDIPERYIPDEQTKFDICLIRAIIADNPNADACDFIHMKKDIGTLKELKTTDEEDLKNITTQTGHTDHIALLNAIHFLQR